MILLKTKNYKKSIISLPKKDKELLLKQEKFLIKDIFSFRITRAYRGIFRLNGENVILFAIGHRKDIYQNL
ncbi:MAG: hypothetical protein NTZ44_03515 [Candidatus Nomurabacteria bacterium]|nr:hypothetical protein [Candidatus Nomurabacteria bacterium]